MSLKKNTLANYIGQGYQALIGIVMLPFYLKYLGAEAYGLVGFFAVMQSWMILMDMGLSPTLARQVAHVCGQGGGFDKLRNLLRSIEIIFLVVALIVAFSVWFYSGWIASEWLNVETLALEEVSYCVALMGGMLAMRWFSSLYRGGIQGMEKMVWLNGANIAIASVRYVLVLVLLHFFSQAPRHFFEFQFVVALVELTLLGLKFYSLLPLDKRFFIPFSWPALKSVLPFTGSIAYTSIIWLLISQVDKLILSKVLTLSQYGYFALVVIVANGIMAFAAPVGRALLPRMTNLLSRGEDQQMLVVYRKGTQIISATIFPLVGLLALFSNEFIYAWTGNIEASEWAGPILTWYVLGNGILVMTAFQAHLQIAHGKLKLHVINSSINAIVQVPLMIYFALEYGALAAAYTWVIVRFISFLIFPAIIHYKFAPKLHKKWLMLDIFPQVAISLVVLVPAKLILIGVYSSRFDLMIVICLVGFIALCANLVVSSTCRGMIVEGYKRLKV